MNFPNVNKKFTRVEKKNFPYVYFGNKKVTCVQWKLINFVFNASIVQKFESLVMDKITEWTVIRYLQNIRSYFIHFCEYFFIINHKNSYYGIILVLSMYLLCISYDYTFKTVTSCSDTY